MSHCSQCGRYVGPYEACPYCGARIAGRLSVRTAKFTAAVLATVGLAVMWLAATRSPVSRIEIGQAEATMNMAYARVEGEVVRGPTYYADSGYLSFTVDDGTGEIYVCAYRKEADALQAQRRVPALGDRVSVAGTLRVREEGVALTINAPQHVDVLRPEPAERELGSLTPRDLLLRVRVRGQVWAIRQPSDGLTIITLRDATGAAEVAVDQSVEALTGELLPLEPGQSAEVIGSVDLYRDTPQIIPVSVKDIVLVTEPISVARQMSISALGAEERGHLVTVRGTVMDWNPFSAGAKFTLRDATGELTVLLWEDLALDLGNGDGLPLGSQVRVTGELSTYRGELEMIPGRAMDVELIAAGEDGETTIPQSPIRDLTSDQLGETVLVEGEIIDATCFSRGFKYTLDDGTGQVVLVLWLSTYDELADPLKLNVGASVRATGEVAEYEEELQLIPNHAAEVVLLAPGTPGIPAREIGSLKVDDVGSWVTVEGAITQLEALSGGHRFRLGDGTGEIAIFLWQSVHERMPEREDLKVGAWVRVTGLVEAYRGSLEVIPQLPHQITFVEQ